MTKRRLERFRALMAERGYDAVVLRNNSDLRWLTGAARVFDDEVAHTAVVSQEGAWLHTDSRYYGSFVDRMGASSTWCLDQEMASHAAWVARRLGSLRARVVAIEDTVTLGFYEDLETELRRSSLACLFPRLHGDLSVLRIAKDAEEIELMRRAQEVTDAAFLHICEHIHAGQTELEIRAELERHMLNHGSEGVSFDTIVASGPNGANPHALPSTRAVREGDLVVMDYGATYGDYHADMTRTICIGMPSAEQLQAYDAVRHAHEECAAIACPTMTGRELHEHAVKVLSDEGYGEYFSHGLGHGVGLEIHERPFVGRRGDDLLGVGSVFTIEPGVYLPGKFGIRLEDCGVMTERGFSSFASSTHDLVCVG